jgi:hypothetical protein
MRTLPLFLEMEAFRAVHACWDDAVIASSRSVTDDGVLTEAQIVAAADKRDPLWRLVETVTKGPELPLPTGYSFLDKDGTERREVRLQWWKGRGILLGRHRHVRPRSGRAARDRATGHGHPVMRRLSEGRQAGLLRSLLAHRVPVLQAPNALCLDYSAGLDGPLVAYRLEIRRPR